MLDVISITSGTNRRSSELPAVPADTAAGRDLSPSILNSLAVPPDERPRTIEITAEELLVYQTIARIVGGNFGLKVTLGEPGGGDYMNPDLSRMEIILDPLTIKSTPGKARFVTAHEGGHAAIDRHPLYLGLSRKIVEVLFGQIGFPYLANIINDGAVNDWISRTCPGVRDDKLQVYEEMFADENAVLSNPEVQQVALRLGRWPKFAQFGSEILRDWHHWRKVLGEHADLAKEAGPVHFSKVLDPDVRKALEQTIHAARRAISTIPAPGCRDENEIIQQAREKLRITAEEIWPAAAKLVEQDLGIESLRQALNDLNKKQQQLNQKQHEFDEADGDPKKQAKIGGELKKLKEALKPLDELSDATKAELNSAAEKALDRQAEELEKRLQKTVDDINASRAKQTKLDQELKELEKELQGASGSTVKELAEKREKKLAEKNLEEAKEDKLKNDLSEELDQNFSGTGASASGASGQNGTAEKGNSGGTAEASAENPSGEDGEAGGASSAGPDTGQPDGAKAGASGSSPAETASSSSGSPNAGAGQPAGAPKGGSGGGPSKRGGFGDGIRQGGGANDLDDLAKRASKAFRAKLAGQATAALPDGELSETAVDELERMYSGLNSAAKEESAEKALKELQGLEDAMNQDLSGRDDKVAERRGAPPENDRAPGQPIAMPKAAPKPFEDRDLSRIVEAQQNIEDARRAALTPFERAAEDTAERLGQILSRLRSSAKRDDDPEWEKGKSHGHVNLPAAMQAEHDPRKLAEIWKLRQICSKINHAVAVLRDVSGSMEGGPAYHTFLGSVLITNLMTKLQAANAVYDFSDSLYRVKTFKDSIRDEDVQARMSSGLEQIGGTNDSQSLRTVYEEIKRRPEKFKFILIFTDTGSNSVESLKDVIELIKSEKKVVLIHFGLGPNTTDHAHVYPYSYGDLSVPEQGIDTDNSPDSFDQVLLDVLVRMFAQPEKYLQYLEEVEEEESND